MTVSPSPRQRRVVVVGNGIAGCMAAYTLCSMGVPVLLVGHSLLGRAGSGWDREGLACFPDEASADRAVEQTIELAAGSAEPPFVSSMLRSARGLVEQLAALGVPFDRTADGQLDLLTSTDGPPLARAGAQTGHHVLRALAAQVRRMETTSSLGSDGLPQPGERLLERAEPYLVYDLVSADGQVVGVAARHRHSHRTRTFRGSSVILCSGGLGPIVGHGAAPLTVAGSATALARRHGARSQDLQRFEWQLALPGHRRPELLDPALPRLGARVWVPKDPEDARAPSALSETEQRQLSSSAALELHSVGPIFELPDGREAPIAYLDLRHARVVSPSLQASVDRIIERTGCSPLEEPVAVIACVRDSIGGLWVEHRATSAGNVLDEDSPQNQRTSLLGLYAAGEAAAGYSSPLLSGHSLLATLYSARLAARAAAVAHADGESAASSAELSVPEPEHFHAETNENGEHSVRTLNRELCAQMADWLSPGAAVSSVDARKAVADLEARLDDLRLAPQTPLDEDRELLFELGLRLELVAAILNGLERDS